MKLAHLQALRVLGKTKKNPAVGCAIVKNDNIISLGNTGINGRPHAEQNAINFSKENIKNSTLYVTLEPCIMCASVISRAKIKRLYYGADDLIYGSVNGNINFFQSKNCNHIPEIYDGISKTECESLINNFFKDKR